MASEGEKERDVKKVMRTDGGRLGGVSVPAFSLYPIFISSNFSSFHCTTDPPVLLCNA